MERGRARVAARVGGETGREGGRKGKGEVRKGGGERKREGEGAVESLDRFGNNTETDTKRPQSPRQCSRHKRKDDPYKARSRLFPEVSVATITRLDMNQNQILR